MNPMIHKVKCWPVPFQDVWDGRKTAELRLYDRAYRQGDYLLLEEWKMLPPMPAGAIVHDTHGPAQPAMLLPNPYTGRSILAFISHFTSVDTVYDMHGMKPARNSDDPGLVMLSLGSILRFEPHGD